MSSLIFRHSDQNRLKPALQTILESAAQKYGDLGIISGYRSPEHNRRVKGAKESRHMSGSAADIDMSSLDEAGRAALVNDLIGLGATGFITYTDSPNMLHVDVGRPAVHFMHDKTVRNIDKAPEWFRGLYTQYHGAGTADAAALAKDYAPGVPRSEMSPDGGGFDAGAAMAVMQVLPGMQPVQPVDLIPAGSDPRPAARDPLMRFGIGSLG